MEFTLEQVDEVRERTGVSYQEAKEALEEADGDVLEAIIYLEAKEKNDDHVRNNFSDMGNDVVEKLKELVRMGNVTRIYLRKDGETVMNIPITAGAFGALFFPPATIAGIVAALATGCRLEIVKDDGEVIDIQDITEDAFQNVKEKVETARDRLAKMNNKENVIYQESNEQDIEE
ncbi:DUF4342 domain-containing protein [Wukongibacter baidiensis]|uniref:DUF4342 domain-containing protein n=1 Tax=Wukongibacter baidiensis TaxID=1723361 RepID=UPI003D7F76EA